MDGGITSPILVGEAIRSGCDKNIVILTREIGYHKEMERSLLLAARIYKKYPKFSESLLNRTETYNNNLLRVKELEAEGKIYMVRVRRDLSILHFALNYDKICMPLKGHMEAKI
jgi:predicted patatin/cPLA2 family phospholipase